MILSIFNFLYDADWSWSMLIDADWCWLMLIDSDWCWLVLIDADRCWLVLIDAQIRFKQGFLSERASGASPVIFMLACRHRQQKLIDDPHEPSPKVQTHAFNIRYCIFTMEAMKERLVKNDVCTFPWILSLYIWTSFLGTLNAFVWMLRWFVCYVFYVHRFCALPWIALSFTDHAVVIFVLE